MRDGRFKQNDWYEYLEEAIALAICPASIEIRSLSLKPAQISAQINRDELIAISQKLIELTYKYLVKQLPNQIDLLLARLPGGEEWIG